MANVEKKQKCKTKTIHNILQILKKQNKLMIRNRVCTQIKAGSQLQPEVTGNTWSMSIFETEWLRMSSFQEKTTLKTQKRSTLVTNQTHSAKTETNLIGWRSHVCTLAGRRHDPIKRSKNLSDLFLSSVCTVLRSLKEKINKMLVSDHHDSYFYQ